MKITHWVWAVFLVLILVLVACGTNQQADRSTFIIPDATLVVGDNCPSDLHMSSIAAFSHSVSEPVTRDAYGIVVAPQDEVMYLAEMGEHNFEGCIYHLEIGPESEVVTSASALTVGSLGYYYPSTNKFEWQSAERLPFDTAFPWAPGEVYKESPDGGSILRTFQRMGNVMHVFAWRMGRDALKSNVLAVELVSVLSAWYSSGLSFSPAEVNAVHEGVYHALHSTFEPMIYRIVLIPWPKPGILA